MSKTPGEIDRYHRNFIPDLRYLLHLYVTRESGDPPVKNMSCELSLLHEVDVLDIGAEVMIPDFALEHPDGRRAILEIVGFWTPKYLDEKLAKIRDADLDHLLLAVSERLECSADDFEGASDRVLWFKSGIHVYDVVALAETHARRERRPDQNL